MANKLTWLIDIIGADKIAALERRLQQLDRTAGRKTIALPTATSPAAQPSTSPAGGLRPVSPGQAAQFGGQSVLNMMAAQGHLVNIGGQFYWPPAKGVGVPPVLPKPNIPAMPAGHPGAGGIPTPLATPLAQLFQRLAGVGIGRIPGFSALGGMWTARPIAQLTSLLSGTSIVAASGALMLFTTSIAAAAGAVGMMAKSIRDAAHLYDTSARLGRSAGRAFGVQTALGAAGLDPATVQRLLLHGEFRKGTPFTFERMLMAARGTGEAGMAQQMLNERKLIEFTMRQPIIKIGEAVTNNFAPAAKEVDVLFHLLGEDMRVIGMELVGELLPSIKLALLGLHELAEGIAAVAHVAISIAKNIPGFEWLGAIDLAAAMVGPKASPTESFKRFPWLGMEPYRPPANRFERMGFVTTPFMRDVDILKTIAVNTGRTADALTGKGGATAPILGYNPYFKTIPSMKKWFERSDNAP